ncbi:MAG: thioredoxin domain-containing protein [Planctomycetota bacterium]
MKLRRALSLPLLSALLGIVALWFVPLEDDLMSKDRKSVSGINEQNRLAASQSPYLLQHKHNPVDWYPWAEEAFEKAKSENLPIFLSIGYSTCHWCHVMAHESFEDPEVAQLMNQAFVCIKVDREERPDIDHIYMTVCQMITGRGGWPLTIVMTPDKKPFFTATYIPKESRFGQMGMLELIPRIQEMWEKEPDKVNGSAERLLEALQAHTPFSPGTALGEPVLHKAYSQLAAEFDDRKGGFGVAPKFPSPHNLLFLLRYGKRFGKEEAFHMVERTLEAMGRGGIYDHLGFGFHRYSTDADWLVPHFEKMLYDQAMMALAYIESYQVNGNPEFKDKAREIFAYVIRDMTSPEGGFYSAEDADSEGVEGKFYVWSRDEIYSILGKEDGDLFVRAFNVCKEGNFQEEASGENTGSNILHLTSSLKSLAEEAGQPSGVLEQRLEEARHKLFAERESRIHPHKDDKILTDWNGLMIAAMARGAFVFQDPFLAQSARRAADFLLERLKTADNRLLHRYRNGKAGIKANVDDYAFMIQALLNLYEATFEVEYLKSAIALNRVLITHFWDQEGGGFFFTSDDAEALIVRGKEGRDGAYPSGNSVAMLNLLRLSRITGDAKLEQMASRIGEAFSETVRGYPQAFTCLLMGVDFATAGSYEVVISGAPNAPDTQAMIKALSRNYLPNMVLLFRPMAEEDPEIATVAGFTQSQKALNGKATAYVCTRASCKEPATDPEKMLSFLGLGR